MDQTRPSFYNNHNGVRIYSNAKNVTEILIFSSGDIIVEDVDGAYANGLTHIDEMISKCILFRCSKGKAALKRMRFLDLVRQCNICLAKR